MEFKTHFGGETECLMDSRFGTWANVGSFDVTPSSPLPHFYSEVTSTLHSPLYILVFIHYHRYPTSRSSGARLRETLAHQNDTDFEFDLKL